MSDSSPEQRGGSRAPADPSTLPETVSQQGEMIADLEARVAALEAKSDLVFNSYMWTYSTGAPPPVGKQLRFDDVDLEETTLLSISVTDVDDVDRTPILRQMRAGSRVRISDSKSASIMNRWVLTGDVEIVDRVAQFPVTWDTGTGKLRNNSKVIVAFITTLEF